MKILFYADTVFGFGGVQRVLSEIAKKLSEKHQVTILTTESVSNLTMYGYQQSSIRFLHIDYPDRRHLEYYGCKAISMLYKKVLPHNRWSARLYAFSFFRPSYKRSLTRIINEGKYDVVIGVHAFFSLHLASVRHRLSAPVVIGWMHNSFDALFTKKNPYLPDLRYFFSQIMKKLNRLVVLTHADALRYREEMGMECQVIYNPLTLIPEGKATFDSHRLLSIGRFVPRHKGFDVLIEAFARFAPLHPDWTLHLVGEGPEEASVRQLISDRGLTERVYIHPFTQHIQQHYASASIYVLSSRWEGQPLVLFEALAHGLPVVASDIPVALELLSGQGICHFFHSEDAEGLAMALDKAVHEVDWEERSTKAQTYASLFTTESVCSQWENLFVTCKT